ncbi:hypothetical protein A2U01_0098678, partial [Trifolium medium]|nr:hypothetical protein [Trifolium medium]
YEMPAQQRWVPRWHFLTECLTTQPHHHHLAPSICLCPPSTTVK